MRLGQLSRKINIKPEVIIDFVKKEFNQEIGSHLNSKVEDDIAKKVQNHFFTPPVDVIEKDSSVPSNSPSAEGLTEPSVDDNVPVEKAIEKSLTTEPDGVSEANEETDSKEESPVLEFLPEVEVDEETKRNAELVRTEHIVLEGPKVVGKIDLPPPPPVKMIEVDGVMYTKEELDKQKREKRKKRKLDDGKNPSNRDPKTGRAKRKQLSEEQLAQYQKDKVQEAIETTIKNREKRIKEKNKKNAPKAVKPIVKAKKKPSKKIKENNPIQSAKEERKEIKGFWAKLWHWFNT